MGNTSSHVLQTTLLKCLISKANKRSITSKKLIKVPSSYLFIHIILIPSLDWVSSVAVSPDGRYIISGSYDNSIKVFDLQSKQEIHHFQQAHQGTIFLFIHPHSIIRQGLFSSSQSWWEIHHLRILWQVSQSVFYSVRASFPQYDFFPIFFVIT